MIPTRWRTGIEGRWTVRGASRYVEHMTQRLSTAPQPKGPSRKRMFRVPDDLDARLLEEATRLGKNYSDTVRHLVTLGLKASKPSQRGMPL